MIDMKLERNAATLDAGFPNIVLTGKMHAGKSTVREYLTSVVGGYQHVSFAQPLKEMCAELFPKPTREHYQKFGMAVRDLDEDAWARLAANKAELINATKGVPFVCDDCRFPNEVEFLRALPKRTVFIDINASRAVRLNRLRETGRFEDESQLDAPSETALDGDVYWENYWINNEDISKLELFAKVNDIIDKERRK
ncbi:AAA family ATPase [Sinimarinibacterium flocculans]|uniref:AAA family ATPase n=1 Tax=Sinimarinibacterium flocculans TaxID=985250 RepID=UPI00249388A6|nr:hypothetical protein [Sinimarinibacterium flocculans]